MLLSSLGGNASDLEPRVRAVVRGEERGYGEKRAWVWEKSVTQWEVGLVRCEKRKMCVCVCVCAMHLSSLPARKTPTPRGRCLLHCLLARVQALWRTLKRMGWRCGGVGGRGGCVRLGGVEASPSAP